MSGPKTVLSQPPPGSLDPSFPRRVPGPSPMSAL